MTTTDWILGCIGAAIWLSAFGGLAWCVWWGIKNQPFGDPVTGDHVGHIERLKKLICTEFGVAETTLIERTNARRATEPRMTFCYLCKKHLKMREVDIANLLNRDRSTVIHSVRRVGDLIFVKNPIAKKVMSIENQFLNF